MSTNDPEFYQTPKFSPEQYQAPPRRRGCFFYGCIIASVLALLVAILVGILAFVAYRWANRMVDEYTAPRPYSFPRSKCQPRNVRSWTTGSRHFAKPWKWDTAIEPLVLTSDDFNALIEKNGEFKGTVYVKIEGDQVKGRVSFPLDKLKLPFTMVKGRYLERRGRFQSIALRWRADRPPPGARGQRQESARPDTMSDFRKENVVKDVKDPKITAMLRKLESLEIKDGKIILKVRAKPAGADTSKAKAPAPAEVAPPGNGQPKTEPSKNGEPTPNAAPEPAPAKTPVPKA